MENVSLVLDPTASAAPEAASCDAAASNASDECQPYYNFYTTAQEVTGLYVFPTFCLFGLLGNAAIIIVFLQVSDHFPQSQRKTWALSSAGAFRSGRVMQGKVVSIACSVL